MQGSEKEIKPDDCITLPHKKSLKGTSYAKQVSRRLSVVRGVTEFWRRERCLEGREQRVSLPGQCRAGGWRRRSNGRGRCSCRCPWEGKSGSCDKAEQETTCDNMAIPLLACGQVTHMWRMNAYLMPQRLQDDSKIEDQDRKRTSHDRTEKRNRAIHCFLPREIVMLFLESGKVLFIHAWRYSKLKRFLQQVRKFTYIAQCLVGNR